MPEFVPIVAFFFFLTGNIYQYVVYTRITLIMVSLYLYLTDLGFSSSSPPLPSNKTLFWGSYVLFCGLGMEIRWVKCYYTLDRLKYILQIMAFSILEPLGITWHMAFSYSRNIQAIRMCTLSYESIG